MNSAEKYNISPTLLEESRSHFAKPDGFLVEQNEKKWIGAIHDTISETELKFDRMLHSEDIHRP